MSFAARGMVLVVVALWVSVAKSQTIEEALVDAFFEALRDKPESYLEQTATVILGYGRGGAIDEKGIETMIAIQRAKYRATAGRRLMVADLNNNGEVSRAEIGTLLPTYSSSMRARLVLIHRESDLDGNGIVTVAEQRALADAYALTKLSEDKAADLRRLMLLDANNDGWVTLDEAHELIEEFREGA